MPVRYVPIDGERVSAAWFPLLHDIREFDGVRFNVNEGHRTKQRQQELINEKGLFNSVTNPTGAAAVSDNAPHIFTGRSNHAIDFDNAAGVVAAAAKRGVRLTRPIPTEPWHVTVETAELTEYNARRRKKVATFARGVRRARRTLARRTRVLRRWRLG